MLKIKNCMIFSGIGLALVFIVGFCATIEQYQNTTYAAYSYKINEMEDVAEYISTANVPLSEEVERYRTRVTAGATKYGIVAYVDLLMAIMQQESGGRYEDVFQCSESLGKPPNSITTEESIDRACYLIANYINTIQPSGPSDITKIKLILQCYNFGGGFLVYVNARGGVWTQELVDAFAKDKSGGEMRHGAAAERMGIWKYGDQHYTDHVLRYYKQAYGSTEAAGIPLEERMNWLFPNGVPQLSADMMPYLVSVSVPIIDSGGQESTMTLTVHKNIAQSVIDLFTELKSIGFPVRAADTAGYCWRTMVSGSSMSAHSYGIAIDINWNSNPMPGYTGGKYAPGVDPYSVTQPVVDIFTKYGFYWGGNWTSSKDYMHFTYINQ